MGNSRIKTLDLGDKRRDKRYKELLDNAITDSAASIAKLGKDYHQSKSYYRLLSNSNVTSDAILSAHEDQIHKRISKQDVVLCIQDTNYLKNIKNNSKNQEVFYILKNTHNS